MKVYNEGETVVIDMEWAVVNTPPNSSQFGISNTGKNVIIKNVTVNHYCPNGLEADLLNNSSLINCKSFSEDYRLELENKQNT